VVKNIGILTYFITKYFFLKNYALINVMSQKGFAPLFLLGGIAVIALVSAVAVFLLFKSAPKPQPTPSTQPITIPQPSEKSVYVSVKAQACSDEAKKEIDDRGIRDIKTCSQKTFNMDGKAVVYVFVEYGEQVCSDVCHQPFNSFVMEDGKAANVDPFSDFDAELKVYEKSGWLCESIFTGFDRFEIKDSARLIRSKSGFAWEIDLEKYSNPLCEFKGALVQPEDDTIKSTFTAGTKEIDCGSESQLKAICTHSGLACKSELADEYLCHYVKARFGQELNTCDNPNVARVKCEQKYGNSSGQCNSETENKNICLGI
jgi:hypothetical protein